MTTMFKRFAADESGATAIEYGLIASLIAVAIIAALGSVSTSLKNSFTNIAGKLDAAR